MEKLPGAPPWGVYPSRGPGARVLGATWALCVVLSWLHLTCARVAAQEVGTACLDALSDIDVTRQLGELERSFRAQRPGAIAWWTGWNAFNIFNAAVGWYKVATVPTRLARDTWLASSIGASLFALEVTAVPMPGMYALRRMRRFPQGTPAERRETLRRALALQRRAAFVEGINSNLFAHLFGLVYAIASSGYVWARNTDAPGDRLLLAVGLQFVTSLGTAEATLWSVPRRARRDLARARFAICAVATAVRPRFTRSRHVAFGVRDGAPFFVWHF